MSGKTSVVLSSDHAAIPLRRAIADHIAAQGYDVIDIGPTTPEYNGLLGVSAIRVCFTGCKTHVVPIKVTSNRTQRRQATLQRLY